MPAGKQQAVKITVTKKLEETLRVLAEQGGPEGRLIGEKFIDTARGTARQLIARIDDARSRKEVKSGLSPYQFVAIARRACPSLVTPPELTPALLGRIKQKVLLLGITDEAVEHAATRARHEMRQPLWLTAFVNAIEGLLGEKPETETDGGPSDDGTTVVIGRG